MQKNIFFSTAFFPLFITQLCGCFNDLLLKNAFFIMVTYTALEPSSNSGILINFANSLFVLPYIIFGSFVGQLSDKYDKTKIVRLIKVAEVIIVVFAIISFKLNSVYLLLCAIAFMGLHSTFFGPVKFSLLPEHLSKADLVPANAYIEASTFLAILFGTIAGNFYTVYPLAVIITLMSVAIIGYISSTFIPSGSTVKHDVKIDFNLIRSNVNLLKYSYSKKNIFYNILGISWFWAEGSVFMGQLPELCKNVLHATEIVASFCFIVFAIGVSSGCLIYNRIYAARRSVQHNINILLLITLVGIDFYYLCSSEYYSKLTELQNLTQFLAVYSNVRITIDLFIMAALAGAYVLPLYTLLQYFSPPEYRSRIVAANNTYNAIFMLLSLAFVMALYWLNFNAADVILITCISNIPVAITIVRLNYAKGFVKKSVVKRIFRYFLHFFYKVEVVGLENFKNEKGKLIIICNHFSYLEPPIISTYLSENIIFAMYTNIYKSWWMQPILKISKAIPVDPFNPMGIKHLIKLVAERHKMCIFPEGKISTTGGLMKIYNGAALIAAKTGAKILPVVVTGTEKTLFARSTIHKLQLFPKVIIRVFPAISLQDLSEVSDKRVLTKILSDVMHETLTLAKMQDYENNNLKSFFSLVDSNFGSTHVILQDHHKSYRYGSIQRQMKKIQMELIHKVSPSETIALITYNCPKSVIFFLALERLGLKILFINDKLEYTRIKSACKQLNISKIVISEKIIKHKLANLVNLHEDFTILTLENFFKLPRIYDERKIAKFTSNTDFNTNIARIFFILPDKITGFSWTNINFAINMFKSKFVLGYKDKIVHNMPIDNYFGLVYGILLPFISGTRIFMNNYLDKQSLIAEVIYDHLPTLLFTDNDQLELYRNSCQNYDLHSVRYIFVKNLTSQTKQKWHEDFTTTLLRLGCDANSIVITCTDLLTYQENSHGKLLPLFRKIIKNDKEIISGPDLLKSTIDENNNVIDCQNYEISDIENIL
ncbi:MAG: MFS transporter [Rickettsiaceae bacterium]|nr:MFS transporter [Rickettsiaceae bacterium]